jgi:hypothetical protein
MSGMDRYDPVAAIFSATATTFKRVMLFLLLGSAAHFIGMNIYGAPALIVAFKERGFAAMNEIEWLALVLFPFFWAWKVIAGATYILGFLHILLLCALFFFVRSSEENYGWGLVVLLVTQPIHSVAVSYADRAAAAERIEDPPIFVVEAPTRFEVLTSSFLLVLWVLFLVGAIWFLARRSWRTQ